MKKCRKSLALRNSGVLIITQAEVATGLTLVAHVDYSRKFVGLLTLTNTAFAATIAN